MHDIISNIYCSSCGNELTSTLDEEFCENCGNLIKESHLTTEDFSKKNDTGGGGYGHNGVNRVNGNGYFHSKSRGKLNWFIKEYNKDISRENTIRKLIDNLCRNIEISDHYKSHIQNICLAILKSQGIKTLKQDQKHQDEQEKQHRYPKNIKIMVYSVMYYILKTQLFPNISIKNFANKCQIKPMKLLYNVKLVEKFLGDNKHNNDNDEFYDDGYNIEQTKVKDEKEYDDEKERYNKVRYHENGMWLAENRNNSNSNNNSYHKHLKDVLLLIEKNAYLDNRSIRFNDPIGGISGMSGGVYNPIVNQANFLFLPREIIEISPKTNGNIIVLSRKTLESNANTNTELFDQGRGIKDEKPDLTHLNHSLFLANTAYELSLQDALEKIRLKLEKYSKLLLNSSELYTIKEGKHPRNFVVGLLCVISKAFDIPMSIMELTRLTGLKYQSVLMNIKTIESCLINWYYEQLERILETKKQKKTMENNPNDNGIGNCRLKVEGDNGGDDCLEEKISEENSTNFSNEDVLRDYRLSEKKGKIIRKSLLRIKDLYNKKNVKKCNYTS